MNDSKVQIMPRNWIEYSDGDRNAIAEAIAGRLVAYYPPKQFAKVGRTCKVWHKSFNDASNTLYGVSETQQLCRFYGMPSFQLFLRGCCTVETDSQVQKTYKCTQSRCRGGGPLGLIMDLNHEDYLRYKLEMINLCALSMVSCTTIRTPKVEAFLQSDDDVSQFFAAIHIIHSQLELNILQDAEYNDDNPLLPRFADVPVANKSVRELIDNFQQIENQQLHVYNLLQLCIKYDFLNMKGNEKVSYYGQYHDNGAAQERVRNNRLKLMASFFVAWFAFFMYTGSDPSWRVWSVPTFFATIFLSLIVGLYNY